MFERFLVGIDRFAAFFDLFTHDQALTFKTANALFVCADDGFAIRLDQAVHQLFNLPLYLGQFRFHGLAVFFHGLFALIP
ncbi:hypothetical protein L2D01_05315 [Hyphomonadaceae bacterium ML37]|nr:hypothetical protein L2D01_05315 [Hyphomonadaceae bacterium ML37]